jgi:hypothetical protein
MRGLRAARFEPNATALVDKRALAGNSPDDILGGQYQRHFRTPRQGMFASDAIFSVN